MIIYFADRKMNILGQASTNLPKGVVIKEDTKTEEIETGVCTFECRIYYSKETRQSIEEWSEAGNYILRSSDSDQEFYTIISVEIDTENQDIYIYAEDAGMDLLNEVLKSSKDGVARNLTEYINSAAYDSGFEIGINESDDSVKIAYGLDEQTAAERVLDISKKFGYEIAYSFAIDRLEVVHKYINIYKKRGKDTGVQLRLNREVEKITIKKSVENLATSLLCTGSADASGVNTSLEGYSYDDGDFYTSGHYLNSRNALAKWSRYLWHKEPGQINNVGHIVRTFTYDTVSQEELCKKSVEELKKICDIEKNYEVQITHLPDNVKIGDILNIVDDAGNLYLQSRLLKLETSIVSDTRTATLGDYLIRDDGISEKVEQLATQFKDLAKNKALYTWIVYADDSFGNGITIDPDGKDWVGITENQVSKDADLSDPLIYKWSRIGGYQGEPGEPGADGISVVSIDDQYYLSTSSESVVGGSWQDGIPEWERGKYVWKRYKVTWSDNNVTYTNAELDRALNHANEAADLAEQKAAEAEKAANTASEAATNASKSAETASTASAAAQSLANDANKNAADAKEAANTAQTAADEANKEVETINKEISTIKEDAASTSKELQGKITSITETMEASYAKKTDVSETEASLRAEWTKSAAEIRSTMENDYAKKTELTEVQSNLQTQVTQNATDIISTASAVETVKIDASNAQKKAEEAGAAATAAQSVADRATQAAQTAQNVADRATQAAQTAADEAGKAQTAADSAAKAASAADAVAKAAQKDLDTAKANLTAVTNRVDATEEDIAAAQTAVSNAQAAADAAKANAATAQNAANAAQSTADIAKANASTAQNAANAAQTSATNAKTAADNAQKTADEAKTQVGSLSNTVTQMDTKIAQNAAAISLAATKKEVEDKLSGYSTTTEMNSAISVSATGILNTVSGTYTTKSEFNTSVKEVKIEYALSTSTTTAPTSGWSTTAPAWQTGKYMWQKTTQTLQNGDTDVTTTCIAGATGATGSAGKGVKSTTIEYQVGDSGTTAPTGTWSKTIPTVSAGKYLWTRVTMAYTDGGNDVSYSVSKMGTDGKNGVDGKGIKSTTITYQAGTSGTTKPTGTWSTSIPTVSQGQYLWSKTTITYTDNSTPTDSYSVAYIPKNGSTGATGTGVESMTQQFYLSTSKETPTGGSWGTTMPTWSTGKYLWTRYMITYKNPTNTVPTTPVCDSSWEAVNEIEIGGRNLIRGTKDFSTPWAVPSTGTLTDKVDGLTVYHNKFTSGSHYMDLTVYNEVQVEADTEYTLSFYAKGSGSILSYFYPDCVASGTHSNGNITGSSDGNVTTTLTTNWKKYWITWKTKSTASGQKSIIPCRQLTEKGDSEVWLYGVKFEKGNKATDWTPAPEDTEEAIVNVKTIAEQTSEKFSWLVNVNDSTASSLILTQNFLSAVAKDINLTGKVTFNSFDDSLKNTINNTSKEIYHSAIGVSGQYGYILFAELKVTQPWQNRPIVISVINRGKMPCTMYIEFENTSGTNPGVSYFKKSGTQNCYIVKKNQTEGIYELYLQKVEAYDGLSVTDYQKGKFDSKEVTWKDSQVTELPSGAIAATQMIGNAEWSYNNNITYIDGGKIYANTVTAQQIDVADLFAQNIKATGTIEGVTLNGATGNFTGTITAGNGKIGCWNINNTSIYKGNEAFGNASGMYFGDSGLSLSDKFKVTSGGALTATSGKIGDLSLSNGMLIGTGTYTDEYGEETRNYVTQFSSMGINIESSIVSSGAEKYISKITPDEISFEATPYTAGLGALGVYAEGVDGEARISGDHSQFNYGGNEGQLYTTINSGGFVIDYAGLTYGGGTTITIGDGWGITMSGRDGGDHYLRYNAYGTLETSLYTVINASLRSTVNITADGVFYEGGTALSNKYAAKSHTHSYAASGHTHWSLISGNNAVGVGSSIERFCAYTSALDGVRDNAIYCGYGNARWKRVYAANASISTSDERMKRNIRFLDERYEKLFDSLEPVTYLWRNDGSDTRDDHDRIHTGFIAQQVKKSMDQAGLTVNDFAAFCYDDFTKDPEWSPESTNGFTDRYSLAYEEFISLNTHMIQKTRAEMLIQAGQLGLHQTMLNDLKDQLFEAWKEIKKLKQALAV